MSASLLSLSCIMCTGAQSVFFVLISVTLSLHLFRDARSIASARVTGEAQLFLNIQREARRIVLSYPCSL